MAMMVLDLEDFVELAKKRGRLIYYWVGRGTVSLYFFDGVLHMTTADWRDDFRQKPQMAFEDFVDRWLQETFGDLERVKLKEPVRRGV